MVGRTGALGINNSEERASDSRRVLGRVLAYLSPYRRSLVGVLALVLVTAAVQALGPALIGRAIDLYIAGKDSAGLASTMIFLFFVYIVGMVAQGGQVYLIGLVSQKFISRLRTTIFNKVQSLSLAFFDKNRAGDLMSRLVNDIQTINQLVGQGLTQVITSVFSLFGILIAMFLLSWPLALASFVTLPLMIWATILFAGWSRRAFRQTRTTIGDVSSELQEELAGVRVAQAFNRTDENIRRFAQRNAANRDANIHANAVTAAFTPAIDVLSTMATAIVAGFGGWLALNNYIPVGTVVAFFLYVQQFFRPIQLISNLYTQMQSALAGAERIFSLVDEPAEQHDNPQARPLGPLQGRVEFEQVSFSYNPLQTEPTLKDINLVAAPGQTIALVGATGAGKSTLINLIPRFYDASGGKVSLDGQDVRDTTLVSLRSQIGYMLQDTFLFSGSVSDNIRYGRLEATDAEIEAAAQAVSADEFIQQLPQGYQTKLGERGSGLSQGQRQLIAFARAVLSDPRILILDEATSSIDTRTEQLIQQALKKLLAGRTSFVIAHRLSTIRNADQVLVLDQGRIVERGTHTELLARDGLYAELYKRQFRDEAGPN